MTVKDRHEWVLTYATVDAIGTLPAHQESESNIQPKQSAKDHNMCVKTRAYSVSSFHCLIKP